MFHDCALYKFTIDIDIGLLRWKIGGGEL